MKLDLTQEEVQIIINALANMPYAQVATLIPKIIEQANKPEEGKPDLKEVKK